MQRQSAYIPNLLRQRQPQLLTTVNRREGRSDDDSTLSAHEDNASMSSLSPAAKALAQRGKMLHHDLMMEFLRRGTGYALSQGVRESDLSGESMEKTKKAEAEAKKRERLAAAGHFVADPTKPPPTLAHDMILLCGRNQSRLTRLLWLNALTCLAQ